MPLLIWYVEVLHDELTIYSKVSPVTDAERVNVVLGIYKHYPGSLSSLKTIPRVYFTKPNITQVPQSMPRKSTQRNIL
jgi:hypothetical protein